MILYHGTASANVTSVLSEGLKPRNDELGNFFTNIGSNRELVYMSRSPNLADYYALRAAIAIDDTDSAILAIDLDKLDKSCLRVDENFIDIEERDDYANCDVERRKEQRIKAAYDTRWEDSLLRFGACTYKGVVPPEAISVKETKPIQQIRYFHPQFVAHSDATSNCIAQDIFLSACVFHENLEKWVFRNDHSYVVPDNFYVDIQHYKRVMSGVED